MKIAIPKCPVCGKIVIGTVEKVVAELANYALDGGEITIEEVGPDSEFNHTDQTDTDNQTTITNEKGESLVTCEDGHEWYTMIED